MIEADRCQAILLLHREGMSLREIAQRLAISRNTVRNIVARQGRATTAARRDKIQLDPELLGRLHQECDGWVQRIHEKLAEEHGITVAYSTLARRLREYGIGKPPAGRCDRVADEPGAEMQHDTSPFKVRLGACSNTSPARSAGSRMTMPARSGCAGRAFPSNWSWRPFPSSASPSWTRKRYWPFTTASIS